jgi:hypothetical protein
LKSSETAGQQAVARRAKVSAAASKISSSFSNVHRHHLNLFFPRKIEKPWDISL